MEKIFRKTIINCPDCPHCLVRIALDQEYAVCKIMKNLQYPEANFLRDIPNPNGEEIFPIPDWCPLPDAPKKEGE